MARNCQETAKKNKKTRDRYVRLGFEADEEAPYLICVSVSDRTTRKNATVHTTRRALAALGATLLAVADSSAPETEFTLRTVEKL